MNCTGKRCIMQFDKVDPSTCKCVSYCPQATPPMTNGDRIRSMSDEELADRFYFLRCDALRLEGFEGLIETRDEVLDWLKQVLDWLKQEAQS